MAKHLATILAFLAVLHVATSDVCSPGKNCKLPECRCWDDPEIPGGLAKNVTPQIVMLSFGYAINRANVELYKSLFKDIENPNSCPAKGTFFVQLYNSDLGTIKGVYDDKHEVGVTTERGAIPRTRDQWLQQLTEVKTELENSGIPADTVQGFRAPELSFGGDDQLDGMVKAHVHYDSSCVSNRYSLSRNLLWPYTYDFLNRSPRCNIGKNPQTPHKGIWQFLLTDLRYGKHVCATPSACSQYLNTTQQAFDMLFNSFADHYEGNRAPFILYIDALWLTNRHQYDATKQFVHFLRSAFDDTWVITNRQALEWIKDPTPLSKIKDFKPWQC